MAPSHEETDAGQAVILFDGVCNLCNGWVRFVIKRDPSGYFRFAPLQSGAAAHLLEARGSGPQDLSSVIVIEDGQVFERSTAILRIASRLRGPWPLFARLAAVPTPIRDRVYRWVASNRYRWFGRRDTCMIPTPELQSRFLHR